MRWTFEGPAGSFVWSVARGQDRTDGGAGAEDEIQDDGLAGVQQGLELHLGAVLVDQHHIRHRVGLQSAGVGRRSLRGEEARAAQPEAGCRQEGRPRISSHASLQ